MNLYKNACSLCSRKIFVSDGIGFIRLQYEDGHEEVVAMQNYIQENQNTWTTDTKGLTRNELMDIVKDGVDYFLGLNKLVSDYNKEFIYQLIRLFPTRDEFNELLKQNAVLSMRVDALERALEKGNDSSHQYCKAKLEVMLDYNLTSVRCWNTTYSNHKINPVTGEDVIIGITPAE